MPSSVPAVDLPRSEVQTTDRASNATLTTRASQRPPPLHRGPRDVQPSRADSLYAFVAVALGCGLRLGEAVGLTWDDVDLDTGTVQIRRALQRFGGHSGARRPLLAERSRLVKMLRAAKDEGADVSPALQHAAAAKMDAILRS